MPSATLRTMGGCASCQKGSGCKCGCCGKRPAEPVSPKGKNLRKVSCSGTGNSSSLRRCEAAGKLLGKLEEAVVVDTDVMLLLHSAAKNGNMQWSTQSVAMPSVKFDITDRLGSTPLHYAARYGQKEVVTFLIQVGASLEARDVYGFMPLHCAASTGHSETLTLLLDARSDIRAVDNLGNSALHLAAARSCVCSDQIGQLLLDEGADINLKNIHGYTPLACADDDGSRSFTDLLRKCGGTR